MTNSDTPDIEEMVERGDTKSLIAALTYNNIEIQKAAAEELGLLGDREAVDALSAKLHSNDADLVLVTIQSMGSIGGVKALRNLVDFVKEKGLYDKYYFALIDKTIKNLLKNLIGEEDSCVDDYLYVLDYPDDDIISLALEEVSRLTSPQDKERSIATMVPILNNPSKIRLYEAIAKSFWNFQDERTVRPLIHALKTNFHDLQYIPEKIAQTLSSMGPLPVDALLEVFQSKESEDTVLKIYAAKILGSIKDPNKYQKAIPILISEFQNENNERMVLNEIGNTFVAFGSHSVQPLISALETSSPDIRGSMLILLAKIGGPSIFEPIEKAFSDSSSEVRRSAVFAAGITYDQRFKPLLAIATKDLDEEVRKAATNISKDFDVEED